MNRQEKITYKGQEILYFNYIGLRDAALLDQLKANTKFVLEMPGDGLLTLSDFTNTYATDEFLQYAQTEESKAAAKKTRKKAMLGITGIKKIFLNTYNALSGNRAKAFDDMQAAKEYLVS